MTTPKEIEKLKDGPHKRDMIRHLKKLRRANGTAKTNHKEG